MTDPALTPQERRSECPVCPPWFVMCAHLDGQVVGLISSDLARPCLPGHECSRAFTVNGPSSQRQCSCAVDHLVFVNPGVREFDLFEQAQADFRRREAALLGREA